MFLVAAMAGMLFVACDDKTGGSGSGDPVASPVEVVLPDDMEEIDLDWANKTNTLEFEWECADAEAEYSIVFSLLDDLSSPYKLKVGVGEFETALTHEDLDNVMAELGVAPYRNADVYWAIEGVNGNLVSSSEVRSMMLFRFYKPFVDTVNEQEYKVCRVVNETTGEYAVWMAENLRSTKYSDGTEIGEEVRFIGDNVGEDATMKNIYGGYYTWNAAVRGTSGTETNPKVQGACPAGWHMPAKSEWDFLINSLEEGNPGGALKNPEFWKADATNGNKSVSNAIGFDMPAAGYIWQSPDGETPLQYGVIEAGSFACYWTGNLPVETDIIPGLAPAWYAGNAITYAFNANDFGAALYAYPYGRGYSVRCVLD